MGVILSDINLTDFYSDVHIFSYMIFEFKQYRQIINNHVLPLEVDYVY